MTQLLIQGAAILTCGPFEQTESEIVAPDGIYPLSVIPGWQIIDVSLPDDFTLASYTWSSGALAVAPPSAQELADAQAQLKESVVQQTQQRLDAFAQTRNYDGILSACTYATSSVAQFAKEGAYAVTARDTTWSALYQILADVTSGKRATPTGYADIEPELPTLTWPA